MHFAHFKKNTMRLILLLSLCLGLIACSANPQRLYQEQVVGSTTPLAKTPAEAVRNATVEPMQINPGWRPKQWQISAQEPRLLVDGVPSNYRVFSVDLKANKPFLIKVHSWCVNSCLGFSKYVLSPYLILLDEKSTVIGRGFGQIRGQIGVVNQELAGQVTHSGTYYLIVAADNRNPGEQVLVDNVLVVGTNIPKTIAPLRIGMGSYPFGSVAPFLAEPQ